MRRVGLYVSLLRGRGGGFGSLFGGGEILWCNQGSQVPLPFHQLIE